MKKLTSAILILLLCLGIYSCGKKDSASTASTTTTPEVVIYPLSYGSTYIGLGSGDLAPNYCYGTNSSGYTEAPFYSTSTHDLKDRLPSSKWSYPVYSRQGHKISTSWENLWDGNIDMTLHLAEVIADNYTNSSAASGGTGFWSGTKSDGTFSGDNCRDWSSNISSDNGTWGSFLAKDNSTWIDNGTYACNTTKYLLCFMYN